MFKASALDDEKYMKMAYRQAQKAALNNEVPVGAVIIDSKGIVLSRSGNLRETLKSTLGHAELIAVHRACKQLNSWRLIDCTLYVTLEPCFMCAGALVQSRIGRVVFAAKDPKGGAFVSLAELGNDKRLNHQIQIHAGVLEKDCAQLLKDFFKKKRAK